VLFLLVVRCNILIRTLLIKAPSLIILQPSKLLIRTLLIAG